MGKYYLLKNFFMEQDSMKITLQMAEIEEIIGNQLPQSAYKYVQWWSNSATKAHPHSRAWTDAGFHAVYVQDTIKDKKIIFEK